MLEVDARGLSCPIPVMHTSDALKESPQELLVWVDSGTAKANVVNLLKDFGYTVAVEENSQEYKISAQL